MEKNDNLEWNGIQIEPFTLIYDILRNLWAILLGAIGAAMLMSIITMEQYEPRYTTSATFVVSTKENSNAYNNWAVTSEMAKTMQIILRSNTMNSIICNELGTNEMDAQIYAETLGDTNFLTLRVTASSSKEAMTVIRTVMDNYTRVSYYALGSAMMDVLEEPTVPMYPDNALNVRNEAKKAFVLMALFLTAAFGFLSIFSDTVKAEPEIEKKLDTHSLGIIPYERKRRTLQEILAKKKTALLVNNPLVGFSVTESYRKLATKVDYQMKRNDKKAIVVTSVSENEGKSTVAANLALSLVGLSKTVLLIDADLRRPSQFLIFGKEPKEENELGEYLKGNCTKKKLIVKSHVPNLHMVVGKNCYASSTELLNKDALKALIEEGKRIADYVIIDSPPAGLIGDAEILAHCAGAALVVAKQHHVLAEDINDVLDNLRSQETKVLGVVLNNVKSFSLITGFGEYGRYK